MFSGIIHCTGTVSSLETVGATLRLQIKSSISSGLFIDQSLAHDGVCLTITRLENDTHWVDIVKETLSKTTFAQVRQGQMINLEKSLTLNGLLDGHLVQGHIDTALTCLDRKDENGSWKLKFNLPGEFSGLVIPRGSICLNGVSLTIAHLEEESFEVAIIPYTFAHTNFNLLQPGDKVNAEFDVIGKYLLRQRNR